MRYTLQEIAEITGGELRGSGREEISRIGTDSRTMHRQEGMLFLAIKGERHDGHSFIPELEERGIRAFMVSDVPDPGKVPRPGISFIRVKDPLAALQDLAAHHRNKSSAQVIGITGSNGKTIVKEWIHQALSPDMRVVRSPKSYNSQLGVPLSVLLLEEGTELAVFEAGISRPGEMDRLQRIIRPDIGIFTNIGEAHREGFRDREQKIREKLRLFPTCRRIVYRDDGGEVDRLMKEGFTREKLFNWSFGTGADMEAQLMEEDNGGIRYRVRTGDREMEIDVPFRDRASVENAMHVTALMILLGYDPLVIRSRIADLNPVAMRMEMVKGINSCTLVNDSYNSDLVSLSIALDYLNQQTRHERRTLILSDIMQSGREAAELYGEVAGMLRKMGIRRFIGIGPNLLSLRKLFPDDSRFFAGTLALSGSPTASRRSLTRPSWKST
jgi:UDP-N-acetylmuramoyl-tripeptide--D-alanyl-D-alanine ligase